MDEAQHIFGAATIIEGKFSEVRGARSDEMHCSLGLRDDHERLAA